MLHVYADAYRRKSRLDVNMKTLLKTIAISLLLLLGTGRALYGARSYIDAKLQNMIIPEVELVDTSVSDCFEFITDLIREVDRDPDKRRRGINIVLDLEEKDKMQKISWQGRNKSVKTIIEDICLRAGLSYSIHKNTLWITSESRTRQWMETRTYNIPIARTLIIRREGAKTYFEKRGVDFPKGASCIYIRGKAQLLATNTEQNLAALRKVLYARSSGGAHAERVSRLKGGPFEGQNIYNMRGSKIDKRRQGNLSDRQKESRTRQMKEKAVYEQVLAQRAYAREQAALAKQLDQVVIPQLELNKTSVKDALRLLENIAFEYSKTSPNGQAGFQAILRISPKEAAHPVSFRASNIPLMQAVRAILSATGLLYELKGTSLIVYSNKRTTKAPTLL